MRLELLFHVVFLIACLQVRFVQYRQKKSDRLMDSKIFVVQPQQRGPREARQRDYAYGLVQ